MDKLLDLVDRPGFKVVVTDQSINEFHLVATRPKFQRYFDASHIQKLEDWLDKNALKIELGEIPARCRDPKDDYLLELAIQAKAIYLVSGDEDLLVLGNIEGCQIMTLKQFEAEIETLFNL